MVVMMLLLMGSGGFTHKGAPSTKAGGTGLNFYAKHVLKGNYLIGSCGMRFAGTGTITISGLPNNAVIPAAYLVFSVIADGTQPNGYLDGNPITGTLVGSAPSPCWGENSIYTYIADVTDIVAAHGNGTYSLSGFYNSSGDYPMPGGTDGASLVVIYCDDSSTVRTVVLFAGAYTLNDPDDMSSYTWTIDNFQATNPVTSGRFSLLFADGQDYWNESYAGYPSGLESVYFQSYLLKSGQYGLPGANGNLWDAVHYHQAASYIPNGASSVQARYTIGWDGNGYADCVTVMGSVLSVSSTENETDQCVTDVEEGFFTQPSMKVMPGFVRVSLPFKVPGSLKLYATDGRLVATLADNEVETGDYPVPDLKPGVYLLKLHTDIYSGQEKLVVR